MIRLCQMMHRAKSIIENVHVGPVDNIVQRQNEPAWKEMPSYGEAN